MKRIIINGTERLFGEISVSGSKNAALPMILSALAVEGVSRIFGVPKIGDVEVALELLSEYGVLTEWQGDCLKIDTGGAHFASPSPDLVAKIRASTYLIGASLARFSEARILKYGGCDFSKRPIDLHIDAAIALGARLDGERLYTDGLSGGEISFRVPSVGATVNSLIMAASAVGRTVIRGFAREPHVMSLIDFLCSAGAKITVSENEIQVVGTRLKNGCGRACADMIEAGSYIAAGALVGGELTVVGAPTEELSAVISAFCSLGVDLSVCSYGIKVLGVKNPRSAKIVAAPYPAFPTDLQPIFAPLMAMLSGGEIYDTVWEGRFGYLDTLSRFGLRFERRGGGAVIYPSKITPATVAAPDLRGGMASVLLALASGGESVIYSADTVLRGYENIEEKLRGVGAKIKVSD